MKRQLFLALAAVGIFSSPVLAATSVSIGGGGLGVVTGRSFGSTVTGYDVSYPECGATLPTVVPFAVVGVNGGIANNENSCLATQLTWAQSALGGAGQPATAVYANTGNPGDVTPTVPDWPASGTSPLYGTCSGTDTAACAYVYGVQRATQDLSWAKQAGLRMPGSLWWLDVETENSWSSNQAANAADLEGMVATLRAAGGAVGLYSASNQWNQIVGKYDGAGRYPNLGMLNNLPNWVAGATSLAQAQKACTSSSPFTAGGYNSLAQYAATNAAIDSDYSCRR